MTAALELDHVTLTYAGADGPVLRDVVLRVEEGELCLVAGRTGTGKSTLLGLAGALVPHFTGGTLAGTVRVHGRDTRTHRPRDLADVVGVVGQDPVAGFVTDTVEEELAYAMEQLALDPGTMRRRVEETLDLLGIAELRDRPLRDLSGGQQQRVAIGAALTAHPRLLVLDEPTSALDPTAAEEVLAALTRLVHDLGMTVLLAEHRLERVLQLADRLVHVRADGSVRSGEPAALVETVEVAPPVVELGRLAGWRPLPLSVRDARRAATGLRQALGATAAPAPRSTADGAVALRAEGVVVRHGTVTAVAGLDLALHAGSVTALMGRNGAGKSSLLWALQGTGRRAAGRVQVGPAAGAGGGQDPTALRPAQRRTVVGLVPQQPADLLYLDTVGAELDQADRDAAAATGTAARLLARLAPAVPADRHPRDLSEGQRLALVLAVQLTAGPAVLLLDEPTRGLDALAKRALRDVLRALAAEGRSVLLSTHDVEFVAETADRVLVMAAGELVTDGPAADVLAGSPAYAPQVAKVVAPHRQLTVADVAAALPGLPWAA